MIKNLKSGDWITIIMILVSLYFFGVGQTLILMLVLIWGVIMGVFYGQKQQRITRKTMVNLFAANKAKDDLINELRKQVPSA